MERPLGRKNNIGGIRETTTRGKREEDKREGDRILVGLKLEGRGKEGKTVCSSKDDSCIC